MSHENAIEVHVRPDTTFVDLDKLGQKMEAWNEFDPSQVGPSFKGYVKFKGGRLFFYESYEGQDIYSTRLVVWGVVKDLAKLLAKHINFGEVVLLDLPEGNPASVYVITSGNVNTFIDGNKARWG